MVLVLVLVLVVLPVLEVAAAFLVAHFIGWLPTLLLLLVVPFAGVWVVKLHGVNTVRRAGTDLARGRLPGRALLDGAIAVVAGCLLVVPGFLTDLVALLLLIPFVRAGTRKVVVGRSAQKLAARGRVRYRSIRGG